MNHQFEDLRAMFTSFMSKQNNNREEPSFVRDGVWESSELIPSEEMSVQENEKVVAKDETKQWVKKKVEFLNFDKSDPTS